MRRATVMSLWAPVVLYMAAIFYVSSLPDVSLPSGVSDVSGHSIAYLGLSIVVLRALAGGSLRRTRSGVAASAVAITVAYGASDEWHQAFVPGRSMELRDLMADATGAVVGAAACWAWGIIASTDAHS